jgi:UDP-2,4-diacetamido-2,4,6-trideoxy-beta-L-altropyranose hydrolase
MTPMRQPLAVFRADASAQLGGGHVMRCLTLAGTLQAQGYRCAFAGNREAPAIVPALKEAEFIALSGTAEAEPELLRKAWPDGVDCLVVDHYQRGAAWEAACRGWARVVMAIDDLADRPHDCDILLDQTLGRQPSDYGGLVPAACHILSGSDYALLHPSFAATRQASLARRSKDAGLRRLLVSLGFTDPADHTTAALQGIAESGLAAEVDVVLGSGAPHLEKVREAVAAMPQKTRLIVDSIDMARLMRDADLAIGAAGTSTWERCCLGLPCLLVVIAENQQRVAEAVSSSGAARLATATGPDLAGQISSALRQLSDEPAGLREMSKKAAAICDGRGADRAGLALVEPGRSKDGRAVALRFARPEDEALILEWQRHPATRHFARNPAVPSAAEHHAWFTRRLAEPQTLLTIITADGEPTGLLRLDPPAPAGGSELPGSREISILVDPNQHGKGIGLQSLLFLRRWQGKSVLAATVLPGNAASKKLFRDAGYLPGAGDLLYSHPACECATAP